MTIQFIRLPLFIALLGLVTTTYGQITWKVNTKKAKITFNEVGSGAEGTFAGLEATIKFDPAHLSKSSIKARIKVATVTAKEGADQAKDIMSKDYLNAQKFPYITYESTSISKKGKGFELTGKLTIKKATKEVTIPFEFINKNKQAIFKGKISISAKDFGLDAGDVDIELEVPVNQ